MTVYFEQETGCQLLACEEPCKKNCVTKCNAGSITQSRPMSNCTFVPPRRAVITKSRRTANALWMPAYA